MAKMMRFDRANKQYIALDHFIENLSNPDVGEVIITHMGRDGMKTGPDFDLIKMLRNHIKQPMIYSGGVFEDRCFDAALPQALMRSLPALISSSKAQRNQF